MSTIVQLHLPRDPWLRANAACAKNRAKSYSYPYSDTRAFVSGSSHRAPTQANTRAATVDNACLAKTMERSSREIYIDKIKDRGSAMSDGCTIDNGLGDAMVLRMSKQALDVRV